MIQLYRAWLLLLIFVGTHLGVSGKMIREYATRRLKRMRGQS